MSSRLAPGRAAPEAKNARAEAAAKERASHLTVTIMESPITTSPFSIGAERGSKGERVAPGEPGAWVLTTVVVDERQDYWSKETQLTLAP